MKGHGRRPRVKSAMGEKRKRTARKLRVGGKKRETHLDGRAPY